MELFTEIGSGWKDLIIIIFIIFSLILSAYVLILNSDVQYYYEPIPPNRRNLPYNGGKPNDHAPNTFAVVIASLYIAMIGILMIYAGYTYYKHGKILGRNK